MNSFFNAFNQAEIPSLTLCKPNKDKLYSLALANTTKEVLKYNAQSTLDFVYPKYIENPMTGVKTEDPAYDSIKGKMLINIGDERYYIINSCPESSTGGTPTKAVSCLSLESEMLGHRITGFTGTYQFLPLLQLVLGLAPSWTIGYIDHTLLSLYRTFNSTNVTMYAFITTDMSKAFNCVFTFDSFTKTVSATANLVPYPITPIIVSFDNLITKVEYKEITEEICTALSCYGGGGLDIHYVNPLGSNIIYNFNYFKLTEWMTQGLINALNLWEAKVTSNHDNYVTQLTNLETYDGEMVTLLADLSDMNAQLFSLQNVKDARTQQGLDTSDIDTQISQQRKAISSKNTDIASKQKNIDTLRIALRKIVHSLFFTSQVSYINFKEDVANITISLTSISTNWTNIYNSSSTYPEFNNNTLTSKTPTINNLIISAQNKNTTLLNYLSAGLPAYPPSSNIITTLKAYINDEISTLNSLYGTFSSIIPSTAVTTLIDQLVTELTAYLDIISYPSNMTDAQYLELSSYIMENSYTNENIIMTPTLTPAQVQIQAQGLYDCGEIILGRTCVPRYEFTGEFGNLMALKEFSTFANQLDIGKVITIIKGDDTTITAVLLTMSITYDNPSNFSMTFGNSLRLDDPTFIYSDLLGPITPTPILGVTGINLSNIPSIPISDITIPSITVPTLPSFTIPTIPMPTMPSIPSLGSLINGETKTFTWVVANPIVGGIPGPRIATDCTMLNFYSQPIGGTSVSYNIEVRNIPSVPGRNVVPADFISYSPYASGQVGFTSPIIYAGDWLWLDISDVQGSPTQFVLTFMVAPIIGVI